MSFEPTPFAQPTGIEWGSADRSYGRVKYGDDSQLVVIFYTRPVFNALLSQQKGTRQYENQTWIKMHPPGEKLNIIDRRVQESDKVRFPHQWNMFLQNKTQVPDGTPIDLLFPNNPAVAENLRAFGVHTIQQCANLSAHALDTIGMGAVDWKNMAVKYIENAKSGTAFLQLQTESARKDQEIKLLKRQLEQMQAQLDTVLHRYADPNAASKQPGWVSGYDVTADRINNTHPSKELRPTKNMPAPPQHEIDHANLLKQVTEEDFKPIDVTADQNTDNQDIKFDFGTKGE